MEGPTLVELAVSIVRTRTGILTCDEIVAELGKIHTKLKSLEDGEPEAKAAGPEKTEISPAMVRKSIGKDAVTCLLCGKGGMKTLARHLKSYHGISPKEYRKQFGIPCNQALVAKNFSEARRKMAQDRGLADNLTKARAVRAAKLAKEKKKQKG